MNYSIIDGADRMDISQVMTLLKQTYWADQRSPDQVRRSMENSRCYGITVEEGQLVGFARVISDFATTYYLCVLIFV